METANEPQWIPYAPPPRNRGEHVVYLLKRYGFAWACVALGLVIALTLFIFQEPLSKEPPQEEPQAAWASSMRVSAHDSSLIGPDESTARLSVTSDLDGAVVLLNRDTLGTTPLRNYKLRTGAYLLSVAKEGYAQADSVILLRRDASPEVVVRFDGASPVMAVHRESAPPMQREVTSSPPAQARAAPPERTSNGGNQPPQRPTGWQESEGQRRTRISGYIQEVLNRSRHIQQLRGASGEELPADTAQSGQSEQEDSSAGTKKQRIGW